MRKVFGTCNLKPGVPKLGTIIPKLGLHQGDDGEAGADERVPVGLYPVLDHNAALFA